MKTLHLFLLGAAFAALSAGCSSYDDDASAPIPDKGQAIELYAKVIGQADTRADITVGTDKFTGKWAADDAMGVIAAGPGSTDTPAAQQFTYDGTTLSFKGSLPSSGKGEWGYLAFHPYAAVAAGETAVKIPFANLRTQKGNEFNSAFDALVATPLTFTDAEPGKTDNGAVVTFDFNRLTSILHFTTGGSKSEAVKALLLTSKTEPLSAATLDFDAAMQTPATLGSPSTEFDTRSNVIALTFDQGTAPAANAATGFFNIPEGNYEELTLDVVTADNQIGTLTVNRADPSKPFVAGKLYTKQADALTYAPIAAPSLVWPGEDGKTIDQVHQITTVADGSGLDYSAAVQINVPGGIAGLSVAVTSDVLAAIGVTALDIFNETALPGLGIAYNDLGLECSTQVQYKKATTFNITALVPLIKILPGAAEGSLHTFTVTVTDLAGQSTTQALTFQIPLGPIAYNADADLWKNTATLTVDKQFADKAVAVEYRIKGETVWNTATLAKNADGSHTATIAPTWSTTQNAAGLDIHKADPKTGVFATNTYEYQLTVDGTVTKSGEFTPDANTGDMIPGADFEDSALSCWGESNNDPLFWGSGNCTVKIGFSVTTSLCKQGTYPTGGGHYGNLFASEKNTYIYGKIVTAGNLFSGSFNMNSMVGTVGFGAPFTYTARPTALKLKYAAKVGLVNKVKYKKDGVDPIAEGQPDKARLFVCIVDWDARHGVGSGPNSDPTGTWDPETQNKIGTGDTYKIIAYGSIDIDSTTILPENVQSSADMTEISLPLNFYDKDAAKPSKKYGIIISGSTSKYGDYMNGCTTNVMYLDDFQWVY